MGDSCKGFATGPLMIAEKASLCPERKEIRALSSYSELHRPQFHFSAKKNWINDPNGLVYHDGIWHLFFQHNIEAPTWGPMWWGHAVSNDLLHWRQLDHALSLIHI